MIPVIVGEDTQQEVFIIIITVSQLKTNYNSCVEEKHAKSSRDTNEVMFCITFDVWSFMNTQPDLMVNNETPSLDTIIEVSVHLLPHLPLQQVLHMNIMLNRTILSCKKKRKS